MQNRLLSILLALALIVSLSVTVFASGEQPSGSDYSYFNNSSVNYTSNYWTAVTKSLFNIGTNIYSLNHGSFNYVNTSGSSTSTSSGALDAITKSLTNIGYLIKNTSSNSVWSSTQASSLTSNSSTIASKSTSIESHTAVIDTNSTSIKTYTEDIYRNSNSLLSYLGSPDSGSTFWNNALATKENTDTLVDRTASLDLSYNFVNSSGAQSTSKATWWNAVNSSLINTGTISIALQRHLDADFHSLHNKIGNPIDSGSTLFSLLTDLHTVFASPEDLEMHNNNSANYTQANDDFFTGQDSSTSIGSGSLSGLKDFGSSAGQFLGTNGVSPTEVFNIIQSDDSFDSPWVWFTQGTKNSLDNPLYDGNGSVGNLKIRTSSSGSQIYDLYSEHQEEFYKALGGMSDG